VIIVLILEKPRILTRLGGSIKNREFPLIDIGISAEHFCLQAAEEGLGTCMIGWFNEKKIKKVLAIPGSKRIGMIITLGYPETDYKLRTKVRKELDQIVFFDQYGKGSDPA
jgi:nitroreductase